MKKLIIPSKRLLLALYLGMWTVFIVAGIVWLTIFLVGTLSDSFADEAQAAAEPDTFDSVVALTERKVARHLGEWEFSEPKLPGHFHHIGHWYESDDVTFCIKCHGPIPHSRSPKERAFLNMHSLFISCQVCHVREHDGVAPAGYGWIDITGGSLCDNPDMTDHVWGEYGAKIIALAGSGQNARPVVLKEEEDFAAKMRQRIASLSEQQKAIGNRFIHRQCSDSPVRCSDCHNTEKPFLPYADLGYSSERTEFLISAEVADLAIHYETFYLPNLLNTGQQQAPGTTGDQDK